MTIREWKTVKLTDSEIVDQFKALKAQVGAPCHCTGSLAIEQFQQIFQDPFHKMEQEPFLL